KPEFPRPYGYLGQIVDGPRWDEAMSKIAEYNPLVSIKIPGVPAGFETKGLLVIVGPNSSGKTLLLKDIENKLMGADQQFIVCEEMFLKRPSDTSLLVKDFLEQKMIEQRGSVIKIASPHFGRGGRDNTDYTMDKIVALPQTFNEGWGTG